MHPKCFVKRGVDDIYIDEIRKNVCSDLIQDFEGDGEYYCLLHSPTRNKDIQEFHNIVANRIGDLRRQMIEHATPRPSVLGTLDLRYVWFPECPPYFSGNLNFQLLLKGATFIEGVDCHETTFSGLVDLSNCVFDSHVRFTKCKFELMIAFTNCICNGVVDFASAEFKQNSFFSATKFHGPAYFDFTRYYGPAGFDQTKFFGECRFNSAKFVFPTAPEDVESYRHGIEAMFNDVEFHGLCNFEDVHFDMSVSFKRGQFLSDALFRRSRFSRSASFNRATFERDAYFSEAVFRNETAPTSFEHARFYRDSYFHVTHFCGGAMFDSAIFGIDSDMLFRQGSIKKTISFRYASVEGLLRFTGINNEECVVMDFQEISTEKATRVGFHSVKVRPNWFINADSRKFVFTNVRWNLKGKADQVVIRELQSMKEREIGINLRHELLTIALRHLAINAEDANSLEQASRFRRLAFECERSRRKYFQARWWTKFKTLFYRTCTCRDFPNRIRYLPRKLKHLVHRVPADPIHFIYRRASSFGENWVSAALALFLIWFGFGVVYFVLRGLVNPEWTFSQALGFSTSTMLLQKIDGSIESNSIYSLRTIQMIATPLQAALLALAIRRKFMR